MTKVSLGDLKISSYPTGFRHFPPEHHVQNCAAYCYLSFHTQCSRCFQIKVTIKMLDHFKFPDSRVLFKFQETIRTSPEGKYRQHKKLKKVICKM